MPPPRLDAEYLLDRTLRELRPIVFGLKGARKDIPMRTALVQWSKLLALKLGLDDPADTPEQRAARLKEVLDLTEVPDEAN